MPTAIVRMRPLPVFRKRWPILSWTFTSTMSSSTGTQHAILHKKAPLTPIQRSDTRECPHQAVLLRHRHCTSYLIRRGTGAQVNPGPRRDNPSGTSSEATSGVILIRYSSRPPSNHAHNALYIHRKEISSCPNTSFSSTRPPQSSPFAISRLLKSHASYAYQASSSAPPHSPLNPQRWPSGAGTANTKRFYQSLAASQACHSRAHVAGRVVRVTTNAH